MKGSRVAIRYAKALLATAKEQQAVDQVADEMELVYTTLENNQELKAVLASPVISAELKGDTLNAIFGKLSPAVKTFLALVTENNRANHLGGAAFKYKQLYQELQGKQEAEVTTAVPLTPALEKVVMEKIKTLTDKKVELVNTINQDIIGGFILRLGDQQFDASVANQLQSLGHKLSNRKALS